MAYQNRGVLEIPARQLTRDLTTESPIMSRDTDVSNWEVIRILPGDPGKMKSSFGIVLLHVYPREIRVMGAKRFGGKKAIQDIRYTDVEKWIADKHKEMNFHYVPIETNNTGKHVVDDFRTFYPDVPIYEINTVGKLTNPELIKKGHTMDRNNTAILAKKLKDDGILKFSDETTPDIEELKRQMETFLPTITSTGIVSYHAEGSNQDDLVMALLLGIHVAIRFMNSGNIIFYNPQLEDKKNFVNVLNTENDEGKTGLRWTRT